MKRFLAVLVLCSMLLVGCLGNKTSDMGKEEILSNQDPVIIEIWTYYNSRAQEVLDRYIKKFNQSLGIERGIIVRQVAFGEIKTLTDALKAAGENTSNKSKMPDLFITYKGIASTLSVSEDLLDFGEYISDEEFNLYVDAFVKTGCLPNHPEMHQMFSLDKASEVLMINATTFDEFVEKGVLSYEDLSTYEGLAAAAERYYTYTDQLTEVPHDGKALFGANAIVNLLWLSMAEMGHDITRIENGREVIDIDRNSFQRFYDYIYIPYVKGHFDNKNRYVTDDMRILHTLVGQSSTSSAPFFPKEVQTENGMVPIQPKVLPLPIFAGEKQKLLIQGGGVFGYKHSEKAAVASVVFLKWLTNEENAFDFAVEKSYMPALKSVFDKEKIESARKDGKIDAMTADILSMLITLFENSEVYEPTPSENYEKIRGLLSEYVNSSWKEAREEYRAMLESGSSDEELKTKFESREAFDTWFAKLNDIIKDTSR